MSTRTNNPWSLQLEDELDAPSVASDSEAFAPATDNAGASISSLRTVSSITAIFVRPARDWAAVILGVAAVWVVIIALRAGTGVAPAQVWCVALLIAAALGITIRLPAKPALPMPSHAAALDDPDKACETEQVWKAVESQAAKVQTQLDEVLEEHAKMCMEVSLANSQKRQVTTILETIRDSILVVDAFDQLSYLNSAAEELFGLSRAESLRKPIASLIQDDKFIAALRQANQADARAAKRRLDWEFGPRTFSLSLAPARFDANSDENGASPHGVIAILRDITKEKEASRRKSEFVAQAAHELRTPLSAIRAYVEMLVDGEAADEKTRAEYYGIIQNSSDRLGRMIENILNISRIEAGTVRINKSPVAISLLVKEAADTLRPQAEQKRITLSEELAPVVDRILADRDLIHQAILNLISNAIKYTPEGGQVNVRMTTQQESRAIRIEIRDNGVGIPKEDLPRMFEKFFRVEQNKKVAAGTGLGLSLVKQIVESVHGGEVSLTSEQGVGSTFAITLPSYEENAPNPKESAHVPESNSRL